MHAHGIPLAMAIVAAVSTTACLAPGADVDAARDADGPVVRVAAADFEDHPAALDALPRSAHFSLSTPRVLDSKDQPVMLFQGVLDSALVEDLKRAPISAAQLARIVPSEIAYGPGTQIHITPQNDLESGAAYTLAIAGFARFDDGSRFSRDSEPFGAALQVSAEADAGARVLEAFPGAGSAGVPTNLGFCALVLDGAVTGEQRGVWLQTADGLAVPARVSLFPCEELDASGSTCIQLVPDEPLLALTSYSVNTGAELRDAHDAPVAAFSASFVTGAGADHVVPHWQPPRCAIDETALPVGCALVDDTRVTLRMQVDEPARIVVSADQSQVAGLAPRGASSWSRSGYTPGQTLAFEVSAIDAAANACHTSFTLTTEVALPTLSITEVRADPLGPEPAQEYVELLNYGATPIALAGFTVSDSETATGNTITGDAVAYPGARVLLVPDAFDPQDALDVAPPAATPLVRVGKSLGKGGLANSGESVYLRDPLGRRVSAAPASPKPKPGVCLIRTTDDPRSGTPESFGYDADGTCTPGL